MFRRHTLDMCFVERKSVSAEVRYGVQPNLPDWLLLAVGVYCAGCLFFSEVHGGKHLACATLVDMVNRSSIV